MSDGMSYLVNLPELTCYFIIQVTCVKSAVLKGCLEE